MQMGARAWLPGKLHSEHQERQEHDGGDDQADEDHGLFPSGDPRCSWSPPAADPCACSPP